MLRVGCNVVHEFTIQNVMLWLQPSSGLLMSAQVERILTVNTKARVLAFLVGPLTWVMQLLNWIEYTISSSP
ncbi:unnamed protein product, partial [Dicrocoelium dendriticum]